MRLFPLILLPLTFLSAAFGPPPSLQQALDRMDQEAARFKGLTANVTWVTHTAVIDENETQTGSLTLKRPKAKDLRALFDIKTPNPRTIAFMGRSIEVYYPLRKEIEVYDVEKKLGSAVNEYLLLGFGATSKELQQAYTISGGGTDAVNGQSAWKLELTPRKPDPALGLMKAELWLSEQTGVMIQEKLYMRGGDYHLLTFTDEKLNPDIPDAAISLRAGPGVKKTHPLK